MPVVLCGVCPHPPIMVPAVGKKRTDIVARSGRAMLELGRRLAESGARSVVMISPHGQVFTDGIAINANPVLKGDLKKFDAPEVAFELENDLSLAGDIHRCAREKGILTLEMDKKSADRYGVKADLDHGFTVPLYFLREAGVRLPLVAVYMGLLPRERLYAFGVAMQKAIDASGKKVAVLASGDLSHCLTPDAPAGYEPRGREFDDEMVRLLSTADVTGIINMDAALVEKAGECGMRPIIMMLGALDGYSVEPEVLSYEGPFGVGYVVASLKPLSAGVRQRKSGEGYLPGIARKSLESFSKGGKLKIPPGEAPDEFSKPAGVFVSLKKDGMLRGCIGTVFPQYSNIIEETVNNAISAGHRDPRFHPVSPEELDAIDISVDVLHAPEPVNGKEELDPARYGVIVRSGRRQGLLLPNLEGVDTVEQQLDIARQKAGIEPGEPMEIERFEVVRYT